MSGNGKKVADLFKRLVKDYDEANLDQSEKLAICMTIIAFFCDQLREIAFNGDKMVADASKRGFIMRAYLEYKERVKEGEDDE